MLLTIVVVAALLLALIRIGALVAVRSRVARIDPTASEPFAFFCIRQAFDSDCAIIWDAQIPARHGPN